MNLMLPEVSIQMNLAVNQHSKHIHTFNFAEFFTGFVKSALCLDTDGKLAEDVVLEASFPSKRQLVCVSY